MTESTYRIPGARRSRWAYTFECAFEYFIALMATDAFLAILLVEMGLDDATIGVISSLISLAFLFQLFSVLVVQHIRNLKLVVVPIHIASQMFFPLLFLLPFFNIPAAARTAVVVGCLLIGYFGNYLVTSVIFNWGNSFVDPATRANFAATKEIISLLSGTVVSLLSGWAIDRYIAAGNIKGAFLFIAVTMLLFNLCDLVCLLLMKNRRAEREDLVRAEPFWRVLIKLFANRSFLYTVFVSIIWNLSVYMTLGFMGTYKTRELMLSVGAVQLINIAACLMRALFSKPIARYADKTSYAKGIKLGMVIAAVGYLINMFTTPGLWWLVVLYTVLYNVACAGTSQNLMNITYSYVEPQYFVQASAIRYSIGGLCGFAASMLGSAILDAVQKNGNRLFGLPVYGQQVLSALSLILVVIGILFVKFVLQKQKIIAK